MNIFKNKLIFGKEYKINLVLFWLTLSSLLGMVVLGFYENDWSLSDKLYMSCDSKPMCFNSFFGSDSCKLDKFANTPLCTMELVPYGFTYGDKPSLIVQNSNIIAVALVGLFLFFNTFLYNKEFIKSLRSEL